MPARKYSIANTNYRYGFNGKENDNDIENGAQDYGMRIYDGRLGRFLSVDPMTGEYPMLTSYQYGSNRPIDGIDIDGLEWKPVSGADGNITDYTWSGFNADGSAASGTVSGGSIVKDGMTYNFSSLSVGDYHSGSLSMDDGSNIRMNASIWNGGSSSYSFEELGDNGRSKDIFESGDLGNATGASGAQIGSALNKKFSDYQIASTPRPASGAIESDGLGLFDWVGPGDLKALAIGALGTVVRKEVVRTVVKKVEKKVAISMLRKAAVRQAWKEEKALVKATGTGTRQWTKAETKELLETGKVKGYHGHHINSVNGHPELAGNPDNIEFVKGAKENLEKHGGNYQNPTTGELNNRKIKK